jgi:cystine transport system substrate-binding protein
MRTRIISTVIAAVAAVSLVGCASGGSAGSGESTKATSPAADKSLTAVQDAGKFVIGTEGTYRPFSFHEEGSGELTGFDVEIAQAVADELGVTAEFQETQWDAIFAGLEAGRFDAIANQVSITPDRSELYEFSAPYTYSTGVIVVPTDDTSITSFESLDGKRTAQSLTSNWYALAQESGATVEAVEGWAQSVTLVQQDRVDATINDKLTFLDYKKETGAEGLKIAAETEEQSESAFAFRKGNTALAQAVTAALEALAADGTLVAISEKYFGEDVTK